MTFSFTAKYLSYPHDPYLQQTARMQINAIKKITRGMIIRMKAPPPSIIILNYSSVSPKIAFLISSFGKASKLNVPLIFSNTAKTLTGYLTPNSVKETRNCSIKKRIHISLIIFVRKYCRTNSPSNYMISTLSRLSPS